MRRLAIASHIFLILSLAYYDYLQSCGNKVCKWLEMKVPMAFINP